MIRLIMCVAAFAALSSQVRAQENDWNVPRAPFKVFGNTFYVGTQGITALLITSPQGHILIDGGTAKAASQVVENIATLGFKISDVKVILNTHAHFDHAGAISELQRLSGAVVNASPWSAAVLSSGKTGRDDPQAGMHADMEPVANVTTIQDGDNVSVEVTQLKAIFTPGHTPGGTSWSWQSCEGERCLKIVYPDSLTAVSADKYRFTDNPTVLAGFAKSFAAIAAAPCDIMISPHPGVGKLWDRLEKREAGDANALIDPTACRRYADNAKAGLEKRLASEKKP